MRDQTCQTSSPSNFLPLPGLFYVRSVHAMKHDSSNNYTLEQTDQDLSNDNKDISKFCHNRSILPFSCGVCGVVVVKFIEFSSRTFWKSSPQNTIPLSEWSV